MRKYITFDSHVKNSSSYLYFQWLPIPFLSQKLVGSEKLPSLKYLFPQCIFMVTFIFKQETIICVNLQHFLNITILLQNLIFL